MIGMENVKFTRWLRTINLSCPECGSPVVERDEYADSAGTKYQTIRECMNPECKWQEVGEAR